jgi:hypothetical protein
LSVFTREKPMRLAQTFSDLCLSRLFCLNPIWSIFIREKTQCAGQTFSERCLSRLICLSPFVSFY